MVGQYLIPFMIHDKKIVDYEYLNGKIYLVKCKYDNNLIYAGSTKRTLEERMASHRNDTTRSSTSLYNVVCGDWDNWYIELYENYPCYNRIQLRKREGEVIKQIATINKNIAGRTKKEYLHNNREKISERKKEYHHNNRDKLTKQMKKYYQNNRDELLEKRKEKITCNICGCEVVKRHLKRHHLSKKCINQLNQD
jgi:hypothetical protein